MITGFTPSSLVKLPLGAKRIKLFDMPRDPRRIVTAYALTFVERSLTLGWYTRIKNVLVPVGSEIGDRTYWEGSAEKFADLVGRHQFQVDICTRLEVKIARSQSLDVKYHTEYHGESKHLDDLILKSRSWAPRKPSESLKD